MKKPFRLYALVEMPVVTLVEAETEADAREIALKRPLDLDPKKGWALAEEFYALEKQRTIH